MLSWGATTMGLGGVHNYAQVTGLRFLLGVMEAGLFPGFVYYLTFWYRNSERSIRVALILASATLAGAFGGAIAFGVGHMNGVHGLLLGGGCLSLRAPHRAHPPFWSGSCCQITRRLLTGLPPRRRSLLRRDWSWKDLRVLLKLCLGRMLRLR